MIVLLYNFRARKGGQNEIASVYMPYLHWNAKNRYAYVIECNLMIFLRLFVINYLLFGVTVN
jgi:hypothetical protein